MGIVSSVKDWFKKKKKKEGPSAPKGLKVSRVKQVRDKFEEPGYKDSKLGEINAARKKREKMMKEAGQ